MNQKEREDTARSAVFRGQNLVLRALIRIGVSMDIRFERDEHLLHEAAFYGTDETLRLLLSLKPDVNVRSEFGQTPLHMAAACNHARRVDMLLDAGAEIDALKNDGTTPPLHTALDRGAYDAARVLITRGASVHLCDSIGQNPLHVMGGKGDNIPLLEEFIAMGVALNGRNTHGSTPAMEAARNNKTDALKAFVENGADLTITNNMGQSAIHAAAYWGAGEAVRYLVEECGQSPDLRDANGRTPMHWAMKSGREDIEAYLSDRKSRYLAKDNDGQTPFDMFQPIFTHHRERMEALEQQLKNNRLKRIALNRIPQQRHRKSAPSGP